MATINDERLIRELVANHGHYEGDPPALAIWRYTTPEGPTTHGVVWDASEFGNYRASQFVREPVLVFIHDSLYCPVCLGTG